MSTADTSLPVTRSAETIHGRRHALAVAVALLLVLLVASPAAAHVALEESAPADGSTVSGSPEEIVLTFTEDVGDNSFFNLKSSDGSILGRGAPDPDAPSRMILTPPALAPGAYRVEWSAIGSDGHIEKGRLTFTVLAATPAPTASPSPSPTASPSPDATASADPTTSPASPSPSATAAPTATPAPDDGAPTASAGDVLLPIVAGLLLVGGLALLLFRKRRAG